MQHESHQPAYAKYLILLAFAVLAFFGLRTISNSDFWMHLAAGRQLTQNLPSDTDPFSFATNPEQAWVNPSWLYDRALYRLWQIGEAPAAILFTIGCTLLAFALLLPFCRRAEPVASPSFALLLVAWLIAPMLAPGPAALALLCAALQWRILAQGARWPALVSLLLVQILWTNVHSSFLLGPLLGALFAYEDRRADTRRLAWWYPLAMLAATLLNPYGVDLHALAVQMVTNPNAGALIEWVSPFSADFSPVIARHASTLLLIVVALGFVTINGRLPLTTTALGVVGAFLLVVSPRYHLFSGLLVFPFAAISLQGAGQWLNNRWGNAAWASAGRGAVALAALASIAHITSGAYLNRLGSASSFGLGVAPGVFPVEASESILARPDFPARAINLAHDGGYLAWKLPARKVYTDSRTPLYGLAFYQTLGRALAGQPEAWTALVEQHQPEAIILSSLWNGSGHATRRLVDTGQWALAYFDGTTVVLVQRTAANESLLRDFQLQKNGLRTLETARKSYERKVERPFPAPNSARLIGGASVLFSLWRFEEAEALYALVVKGSPTFGLGWQNLGICRFQLNEHAEAAHALERARRLRPDHVLPWLWLGKTYQALDQPRLAERALNKARSINSEMTKTFESSFSSTNAMTLPPATNRSPTAASP